jgi:hypothetical protein
MLAKAHIAKYNELTELEVTELTSLMVYETALAILQRQGSQGITILSSQSKFIFNMHVGSIFNKLTNKMLEIGKE